MLLTSDWCVAGWLLHLDHDAGESVGSNRRQELARKTQHQSAAGTNVTIVMYLQPRVTARLGEIDKYYPHFFQVLGYGPIFELHSHFLQPLSERCARRQRKEDM